MKHSRHLMLACRLCLQLGIDDPELWLHRQPRRVVELWVAYWQIEPWGLPWHRHATWMRKLDEILGVIMRWFGGKYEPQEPAEWMPSDWDRPKRRMPPRPPGNIDTDVAILKARYGKPK